MLDTEGFQNDFKIIGLRKWATETYHVGFLLCFETQSHPVSLERLSIRA